VKALFLHNRYQQAGGEDGVVRAEIALLREQGHQVELLEESNDGIVGGSEALKAAFRCVYSPAAGRQVRERISRARPDVVHIHNFFPRLSPAIHYACSQAHVPVVQTLHNYRLLCPKALLLRDDRVCEACVGRKVPWPAVLHACYRDSYAATAAVAAMDAVHNALGTWQRKVNIFVALTEFAKRKFSQGGLPAEKIVVKPNFVYPDPGVGSESRSYALFVGRLSEEKGIRTLLSAWKRLLPSRPLKLVGEGPLEPLAAEASEQIPGVEWLGACNRDQVLELMGAASFLIVPSHWFEGFPLAVVEAFAKGTPVVASCLGALAELVEHRCTGLHFQPGEPADLAEQVDWAFTHPTELQRFRLNARQEYDAKYTGEKNYELLANIYSKAIRNDKQL